MKLEVLGGVLSGAIGGFILGRAGNVLDAVIGGRRDSVRTARLQMFRELYRESDRRRFRNFYAMKIPTHLGCT